ncbi:MAG: DUF1801 domain-containing protein [Acidobacteria bacterium]|nr:DUF1801 domain-containing protein [Acidobacteriota bacterium]
MDRMRRPKSRTGKGSARSVDAYLSAMPDRCRVALEAIRKTVQATVPEAEEALVYGVPGFTLGGKALVCYAGFREHCGFYPLSPAVIRAHAAELMKYDTAKGTIRFSPAEPLPAALVRKLVRARRAELQSESS